MGRVIVLLGALWLGLALLAHYYPDENLAWAVLLPASYAAGMLILRD